MRDDQPGVPPPPSVSRSHETTFDTDGDAAREPHHLFHLRLTPDTDRLSHAQRSAEATDRERGESDRALYDRLSAAGFKGMAWDLFADALAAYALPIIMNWLYTGEIFSRCAAKGRPVKSRVPGDLAALRGDRDEREELACEAVARGLRTFREYALIKGKWNPEGGASLKTFFVGAVLMEFGGVFERWAGERSRRPPIAAGGHEDLADLRTPEPEQPEVKAASRDFIDRALADIEDATTRTAAFLVIHDYSNKEIGEHLNMSAGAVAMRLSRLRRQRATGPAAASDDADGTIRREGK
ncbi:hypothetical protein GCM10010441_55400 [Kitasatospora paracochleata]|uniref:DNA-directed RNA polymerase specialized sigma24 family protein n=1 Tax=Kitasatospora paracochleata TaxID=58354 RepID=A0ABT1J8G7_9ACTN|nr:hypothetical protein [Kitasatospora paracochleata]MCP2313016.1 DNA-directed RNA polymerase specialized sigma24 family protein [Kitasatospora paracochleata]